jgi:hypothetical protein
MRDEPFDLTEGTGTVDKDGTEIFVNDTVEVSFQEGKKKVDKEVCTVIYEDGCFVAFNGGGWIEDVGTYGEDMKVIGNEYLNLENSGEDIIFA